MQTNNRGYLLPIVCVLLLYAGCKPDAPANTGGAGGNTPTASATRDPSAIQLLGHRLGAQYEQLFRQFEVRVRTNLQARPLTYAEAAPDVAGRSAGADAWLLADLDQAVRLKEAGLLQRLAPDIINKEVDERLADDQRLWLAIGRWAQVFVFSQQQAKVDDLQRYNDITDARWRGKVILSHPDSSGLYVTVAGMLAAQGEAATRRWLQGLAANLAGAPTGGDQAAIERLSAGEGAVAFLNESAFFRYRLSGDPNAFKSTEALKIAVPLDEQANTYFNITPLVLLQSATQAGEVVNLAQFLCTRDAQTFYTETFMELPVNAFVPPPDPLLEVMAIPDGKIGPNEVEDHLPAARALVGEILLKN